MFDPGFTEFVLLFVIALLILGPERLPRVASQIGRWVGRARRTVNQLRHQLEREVALEQMNRSQQQRKTPRQPADSSSSGAESAPVDDAAADRGAETGVPGAETSGAPASGRASADEAAVDRGAGGSAGDTPPGDERTDRSSSV